MIVSTDGPSLPPGDFVSEAMVVAVMASAQRHRVNSSTHRSPCVPLRELGEPQVVGGARRLIALFRSRRWMHYLRGTVQSYRYNRCRAERFLASAQPQPRWVRRPPDRIDGFGWKAPRPLLGAI